MSLTIALDFDNTFTAAPEYWAFCIQNAERFGVKYIIATARRNTAENRETIDEFQREHGVDLFVLYSELGSKLKAAERFGIKVDMWIDDDPTSLVNGH